jgi:hypothetical protein
MCSYTVQQFELKINMKNQYNVRHWKKDSIVFLYLSVRSVELPTIPFGEMNISTFLYRTK